ncbi:hypothetical protein B7L70_03360 [Vulcanisaeta sp. EB80]|uniref:hypothetical protein n=1 Tax=Vulcanisaeta sp. EB80 TaxID=1650660 RepID=UPI0009BD8369|nr:hypothetical protein [Vulcanisaeta sp. EB80]PLC68416.1 hypothetical protein B7L70_03360 [Vulcanisaeta sp. EB80]
MGRVVRGLRAWRNSQSCFVLFLISNSARGARWFSVIVVIVGILGLILGIPVLIGLMKGSVASVVSDYYAELVALMAMLAVLMIAYLTVSLTGFRGLANALPTLVEELRGGAQPGGAEVPPCLVEYFGGRATEVLGRLYSRLLANTSVAMYFLVFAIADLVLLLVIGPPSSLKEPLLTEVPAVLRTSVDVALGILGVIITVVLLPRLLLIGRDAINAEDLRVVRGVRFRLLTWFSIAITLIIVSIMLPPIASIVFITPMILAITISLVTYLTLATTVIKHMQLPRDNQGD